MLAWNVPKFGVANLQLREAVAPDPGPGQVQLRVHCVSLNARDLMMVQGRYNARQPLPLVPCSDAVGEVIAVGDGVDSDLIGQRMCPLFSQSWLDGPPNNGMLRSSLGGPLQGTLQEVMCVDARALVRPPAHLTDAQCATLPCSAVTAWRALVTEGRLQPGDTVLTLGTGGVSLFVVQLATALGARVVITSSQEHKLERAKALGAAYGVNYRTHPNWGKQVGAWSHGGVDNVIELGGAGTLSQSLRAVKTGGTVSLIGVLDGVSSTIPLTRVLMRHIRVQGIFVGSKSDFLGLIHCLEQHPTIEPVVDRVFPFEQAPDAFEAMVAQQHMGKIVVRLR